MQKKPVMKPLPTATSSGEHQSLHTVAVWERVSAHFDAQVCYCREVSQQSCASLFAKVYQTCGTPGETATGSPALQEQRKKSSLTASEYKPSPTAGVRLAMQVWALSWGLYRENCWMGHDSLANTSSLDKLSNETLCLNFFVLQHFISLFMYMWGIQKCHVCPQVADLSSKLREMRQYWIQLPLAICSKLAAGGANQDKCWNGITKAR